MKATGSRTGLTVFLIVILCCLGIYGIFHMQKDEYPEFELNQGLIVALYPGASATEVERQVSKPLEKALLQIPEIYRPDLTVTTKDGICYILANTNVKSSKKTEVWSKIKLKLSTIKATLPPGVVALEVLDDFTSVSTSLIAIESSDKGYAEIKALADHLTSLLQTIPELAAVKIYGNLQEEIAVTLDYATLSQYGINPSSLFVDYRSSTTPMLSGSYSSTPIHIQATINSESEIADKIIYSDPSGAVVRLKDIATIERRYKAPSDYVNYNGRSALILSVEMLPGNDIVRFGKRLDEQLAIFQKDIPQSVSVSKITDQPKVVGTSVFAFLRDLLISMLIVILVMLMLFPMRSALIASSGIPVCVAVTIAVMYMTGISLNTVTLSVLIMVLGMIVDDSIINIDGYMNKLGSGLSPEEAAKQSTKELLVPMLVATLSISLMFYPVLKTLTGYLGGFVKSFPFVASIALMMSFFYAVWVVPSLEVKFIKTAGFQKDNFFVRIQKGFFDGLQAFYDKCQAVCFRLPKLTILFGLLCVAFGVFMFSRLSFQMLPMANRDFFAVEVSLGGSAKLEDTKKVVDSLQTILLSDSRVQSVTSFIGNSAPRFTATYIPHYPDKNYAQLIVNTQSVKATRELLPEYEEKLENLFPEAVVLVKQMSYQVMTPVEINIVGDDFYATKQIADTIKQYLYSLNDELKVIKSSSDDFSSCIDINLDAQEAKRLGVNKGLLSLSVYTNNGSLPVASIWEGDHSIPVNLYNSQADGVTNFSSILNQMVPTPLPNVSVPLRQIATINPSWEPSMLNRFAGESVVTVSAFMKYGKSQPFVMTKIKKYINTLSLPQNIRIEYQGLTAANKLVIPEVALTFICAVLVMFLTLLYHFRKFSVSILTILLSTLSLFGASFGLWLFKLDFSLTAILGIVSLIGIIVRNGIIMFEYTEELRFEQGLSLKEAAAEAGKRRMRPIFLTSLTTALGVLPIIISQDVLWMPMGVAICFGTVLSVFLITLIMPVSYWQVFKKTRNE